MLRKLNPFVKSFLQNKFNMRTENGTRIFEGKVDYAEGKMARLLQITDFIREKDGGEDFLRKTKLVSIVAGTSERNLVYAEKKQEAAGSLGLNLEIKNLGENVSSEEVEGEINKLKEDPNVAGVMLQLPLADKLKGSTKKLIQLIPFEKDLDGMNEDPQVVAPVAQAIWEVVKFGISELNLSTPSINVVVVGARGFVGTKTIQKLESEGLKVTGIDLDTPEEERLRVIKNAEVLISVCNSPDSIHGEMLGEDIKIIGDGSYPHGDFAKDVIGKAKIAALVPGGIGPMTIAALMEKFVNRLVVLAGEGKILTGEEVDKLMASLL